MCSGSTAPAAMMEPSPIAAVVEDRHAHTNQHRILDHASMDSGIVADRHPVAHGDGVKLRWPWSTEQSCTLEFEPTRMELTSPRSTAFIQTEEFSPSFTSPSTCAERST